MPRPRVKQSNITPPTPSNVAQTQGQTNPRLYSEVAASPPKNLSPVVNHTKSKRIEPAAGSQGPPSHTQNRMATRAANAQKHPGLLALDDEDLKAMKKKDEAALRREAKANEKKSFKARLKANTDRVAAFEDTLSQQHADGLANAARPATRAGLIRRNPEPEPVSNKSAQSIVPADHDHAQRDVGQEIVESDASHADDIDYAPSSESESEALMDVDSNKENVAPVGPKHRRKKVRRREAREHIEAHRQVPSRTGNMYVASSMTQSATTNTGKHKHDSDLAEQSAKRAKTVHADTSHSLARGLARPPSPNRNTFTTTTPAVGDDDRFNLRYGGIMDDDIQEMAPPPLKPSQVKVTTRVEHDIPLVKVEALDPGLPGRRRGKAKERSTQALLKLDSQQLEKWKRVLIPAFRDILGAQTNPWDNTNPELLTELKYIYNLVFPDPPREIEHNGPEYLIACQRGCEWRARIAREVLQATEEYLVDTCGDSPTAIAEYEYKGLFLAPYIVAGISAHLEMTTNLPEELKLTDKPRGALALATVAAERALKAWEFGSCTLGEDVSKRKEEEFSEARWGAATNAVMPSVLRMSERKWEKVLERALEASGIVRSTAGALPMPMPNDARALAYEPDSE